VRDSVPASTDETIFANVLSWHETNEYHSLSPYFLRTDGHEAQFNKGNVLFENFWQGSKVWPVYHDTVVWAHKNLAGQPKHLWFEYKCANRLGQERHLSADGTTLTPEYFVWRKAMFACQKPVRYPNGFNRTAETAFSVITDEADNEKCRLDYIEARKQIYLTEYCRLIEPLPAFKRLEAAFKNGKNIVLAEIDVPHNTQITRERLDKMIDDPSIRFGHGLCIAWKLLGQTF
jgi:hypothetical protein